MSAAVARHRTDATRQRRAHAKSKKGCANCKLRRIKCDEVQPSCKKCKLYGVSCDYSGLKSSLDLDVQGSFQMQLKPSANTKACRHDKDLQAYVTFPNAAVNPWTPSLDSIFVSSNLATIVDDSLHLDASKFGWLDQSWNFTTNQLAVLSRFRERTSVTIGNPKLVPLYRDLVCQLACKHTFLMHMLLSVTLMHDAHLVNPLAVSSTTDSSKVALEHWNTASKLFNEILSQPIPPSYRDAIWATGVFIGAASFWSIGSTNPYEVWPLKPAEPDDLSWLRIGEGKKHLWRLAQPLRSDSIFCDLVKDHNCISGLEWTAIETAPDWRSRIAARVLHVFERIGPFDARSDIYYHPVLALSKCPNVKVTHENATKFLYIMAVITPEFLKLLEAKDVRAIFIMGWWYILLKGADLWWMGRRATIEGQAIRIWLREQEGGEVLANLLEEIERCSGKDDGEVIWFFEKV